MSGEPRCRICPVRQWCVAQGEVPRAAAPSRQKKKEIWCALECRDGNGTDRVRLVQRPQEDSLMPGMWELPQSSEPPSPWPAFTHWRTFRHSITVTDYTVHVLRNVTGAPLLKVPAVARGKWIAIGRLPRTPITGLTRKILKAGGII